MFLSRICLSFVMVGLFFGAKVEAQAESKVFVISSLKAALYSAPSEDKKTTTVLNRGRRVEAAGQEQSGFVPVLTLSGTKAWVKKADVTPEKGLDSDVVEPAEALPASTPTNSRPSRKTTRTSSSARVSRAPASSVLGLHRLTFDLGLSTGSVNDVSYTEVNLGLNAYFAEWLAWRNAVFGRFPSTGTTIYGLDTSVRGILNIPVFTAFAGPGYRFVNEGHHAPFGEAGLVLKLGGFAIGGGAKVVLNSWVVPDVPNDTQYFLILAGGGSL